MTINKKEKVHIILIIITFILFMISMRLMRFYANSLPESNKLILDLRFGYNTDNVNNFLLELSEDGRNYYVNTFHFVDTFYPIIYCMFYLTVLSYLIKKCFPKTKILLVLPVAGMICDFIENILLNYIVKNHDNIMENIVNVSSIFTVVKFIMIYTSLALSILFLIVIIIKRKKL